MNKRAAFFCVVICSLICCLPASAKTKNPAYVQDRASLKAQQKQQKATKKYLKKQKKAQNKMFKNSVKNTHYPKRQY
jgi:hypothetical protein